MSIDNYFEAILLNSELFIDVEIFEISDFYDKFVHVNVTIEIRTISSRYDQNRLTDSNASSIIAFNTGILTQYCPKDPGDRYHRGRSHGGDSRV